MGNFYDDNADLRWYMETGIDWEPVVRLTEYDWKAEDAPESLDEAVEMYRDILDLIGNFSADEIAPRWRELDEAQRQNEKRAGQSVDATQSSAGIAVKWDISLPNARNPRRTRAKAKVNHMFMLLLMRPTLALLVNP